jgi:plasmid stabilization system protein ParE
LSRAAEQDADVAAEWYNAHRDGLGLEFLDALETLLERIETSPESFSRLEDYAGTRRLRQGSLRRFPYKVIFEVKSEEKLLVLAVAHTSRRPGYWQDRLS